VEDLGGRRWRGNTICRSCRSIISARNSGLFYWFAKWSTELRDMTVFSRAAQQARRPLRIQVVGKLIPVEHLDGDINAVTRALETHTVQALKLDGDARFRPLVTPAAPEMAAAHSFR
jgi:putative hemolysin